MATTKKTTPAKTPRVKKAVSEKPQAALKTGTRKNAPRQGLHQASLKFLTGTEIPVAEPVIHHDDIALRAYFIGERRQKMGWPGDSATDWADAERQLRAEALEKPLKKR